MTAKPFQFVALCWLLIASIASAADDKKPVPAEEAVKHADKIATVEMTVENSRLLADRNICFLNSMKDFRDKRCFTAVMQQQGLEKFKGAKIEDPAAHFHGKKVRVTGKISLREERAQIIVTEVSQIEIVKEEKKAEKGKDK